MQFKLFSKEVYVKRRDALRKQIGSGIILLLGNEESSMNYKDNCYPFRQDSSFLYYFGLDTPGLIGIINADSGETVIVGDELTMDAIIWTGPLPSIAEMAEAVGVSTTLPAAKLGAYLAKQQVHLLPPYRPENKIRLAALFGISVFEVDTLVSLPLIKAVIAQRIVKEAVEVEAMEEAVSISVDMHLAALQYTRPGMKEYEVAAKVEEVVLAANGRLSYPIICTINGQTLHNHYHGNMLVEGQLLLLDAGAENDLHYAGDLTRTFPVGKRFTTQQRELYDIVLASLEHAVTLLRPGIQYKEVHTQACIKLMEGLKAVGLVKGNVVEAVAAGAHTLFFQCGLGHLIGLDVHDMEDLGEQYTGYTETLLKSKEFGWKSLRLGRELEAGFVLTVEPGVYLIPELIEQWKEVKKHETYIDYAVLDKFRSFGGIRIEDNYLITADGCRKLGKDLPRTAAAIEALR